MRPSSWRALRWLLPGLALAALGCEGGKDEPSPTPTPTPVTAPAPAPSPSAVPASAAAAMLDEVRGAVTLEHLGKRASVSGPGAVALEDVVETGEDGSAVLKFPNGRQVEVAPLSRFVVREDAQGYILEMEKGIVLTRIPRGAATDAGHDSLSIQTPFGLTRLAHAQDELRVSVLKDAAQVDVRVGNVMLVSRNGQQSALGPGETRLLHELALVEAAPDAGAPAPVRLKTLEMTLSPLGARMELRASGERSWKTLQGKRVALQSGDRVRVRTGHPVLNLGSGSSTLALQAGTDLSLGEPDASAASADPALELHAGSAELSLDPTQATRFTIDGASFEAARGGDFALQKDRRGLTVESRLGDAEVKVDGKAYTLESGHTGRVEEGRLNILPSVSPALVVPAHGNHAIYHGGMARMGLRWPGDEGAYRVELSSTPDFARLLYAGTVHQAWASIPVPRAGSLHWRILQADGSALTQGSAHFEPELKRGELAQLRNEVPEGSETTTIYYEDKPPAVTFTFKRDPAAARYRVSVFHADQLDQAISEREYTAEHAPLEAGVLTEGKYLWSVTPLSPSGQPLRGGKMSKLEMVYDNSVPSLLVFSPRNGERAKSRMRTHGIVPVGYQLTLNDRSVPLDEKQRFDTEAAPMGTPPTLVFHLTRGSASDAYVVRELRAR